MNPPTIQFRRLGHRPFKSHQDEVRAAVGVDADIVVLGFDGPQAGA